MNFLRLKDVYGQEWLTNMGQITSIRWLTPEEYDNCEQYRDTSLMRLACGVVLPLDAPSSNRVKAFLESHTCSDK